MESERDHPEQLASSREAEFDRVDPESLESLEVGAVEYIKTYDGIIDGLERLAASPGRRLFPEKNKDLDVGEMLEEAKRVRERVRRIWESTKSRSDILPDGVETVTPKGKYLTFVETIAGGASDVWGLYNMAYRYSEIIRAYFDDVPDGILTAEQTEQADRLYLDAESLRAGLDDYKRALRKLGVEVADIRLLKPPPGVDKMEMPGGDISGGPGSTREFRVRPDGRAMIGYEIPMVEKIIMEKLRRRYADLYGGEREPNQSDLIVTDFTHIGHDWTEDGYGHSRHSASSGYLLGGYFT